MIHFSKKSEYAIVAVEYMARKESRSLSVTSTREISEAYSLPNPLLAKVLQKLANHGLIKAALGMKGGYVLAKRSEDISVADIVEIFEGPVAVAECLNGEKITCPQWDGCHVRSPFAELNSKIHDLLVETKISDLVRQAVPSPLPVLDSLEMSHEQ